MLHYNLGEFVYYLLTHVTATTAPVIQTTQIWAASAEKNAYKNPAQLVGTA